MKDKKHAGLAKAFAAMHHDPDQAAIDAKANKILGKKKGGKIEGHAKKPHLGRPGRAGGGASDRFILLPRSGKEPYTTALNLAGMFGGNKAAPATPPANVPMPPPRPPNLGQPHVRTVVHDPATGQLHDLHPPIPVAQNSPVLPALGSNRMDFGSGDLSSITGYPSQHAGFGEMSTGYGEIPNGLPIPDELTGHKRGGRT